MDKDKKRIPAIPIAFGLVFGLVVAEDTTHWATSASASSTYARK